MMIESLVVGPFQENVFILRENGTKDAIVIDPGDETGRILRFIREHELRLIQILLTHGHIDHVGAGMELKEATGADLLLHREDLPLYEQVPQQATLFGLPSPEIADVDIFFEDGLEMGKGSLRFRVIHTPGHTPGSVSLYFTDTVFTGDALFRDGIGRTDLWGGSHDLLMESIHEKLMKLDDETKVYPGHGPSTTIGRERRENPFLQETYS